MADIFISTDFSSLVEADKALNKLGKDTTAYIRTLKTMAMADIGLAKEQRVLNEAINNMSPALDRVNRQMRQNQKSISQYSDSINKSKKSLITFGFVSQQVGYQVGDFFVQIQSGTNPLVAFGQQATQLAGLLTLSLNPAIAAWGVGLSIAIPLMTAIGAAFSRTKKEAENYIDPLKEVLEVTKKIREETDKIQFPDTTQKAAENLNQQIKDIEEKIRILDNFGRQSTSFGSAIGAVLNIEGAQKELEINRQALQILKEQVRLRDLLTQRQNANAAIAAGELAKQKREREEEAKLQEQMNKKISYGKDVFHLLAGETSSVSMYLSDALRSANGLASVNFANVKSVADYLAIYTGQMGRAANAAGGPVYHMGYTPSDYSKTSFGGSRAEERMAGNIPPVPAAVSTIAGSGGGSVQSAIESFKKQLQLERELVGTSEAYKEVRQALGDEFKTTDPLVIANLVAQQEETKKLIDLDQQRQDLIKSAESALESGFMSMVDGTKSVKEAFRSMASDIIRELYRVLVVQRLVGVVSDAVSGGLSGSPISLGTAAPKTTSSAKLSIRRSTQSMSSNTPVIVNNNINVTGTGDAAYVRGEVAKMMPQITSITKTAVIEARRRGGQMKQAFI